MDYVREALNGNIFMDTIFYDEILEQLDIERDFMLASIRTNIISEASVKDENVSKGGFIRVAVKTIKSFFEKFISVFKDLFKKDENWIKENIDKLRNLNYKGLTANMLPYHEMPFENIMKRLNDLRGEIDRFKGNPNSPDLKNLQTRDAIVASGEFAKYSQGDQDFTANIKKIFKVGEKSELINRELKDGALATVCKGDMYKFLVEYGSKIIPQLTAAKDKLIAELNNAESDLNRAKTKSANESFCILENAYYKDTELQFCSDYNIVFEETNSSPQTSQSRSVQRRNYNNKQNETKNTQSNNTKPENKQNDTGKETEKSSNTVTVDGNKPEEERKLVGGTEYYNYMKEAIQLNQIALAAALTACEEKYTSYITIAKEVIRSRA